ncbi:MAG: hypothetical protein J7K73_03620 [Nanoarchaeota archaeon]|nr:hypothetical protein [Nanoarchaeota archaeon]
MKLSKKAIVSLVIVAIFLSSTLVVFSGKKSSSQDVTIVVDMGNGKIYKNIIGVGENTTALMALSSFAYSVDIQNGSIYCIADYCNTDISEWHAYSIKNGALQEINKSIENYIVSNGETLMFKYEGI